MTSTQYKAPYGRAGNACRNTPGPDTPKERARDGGEGKEEKEEEREHNTRGRRGRGKKENPVMIIQHTSNMAVYLCWRSIRIRTSGVKKKWSFAYWNIFTATGLSTLVILRVLELRLHEIRFNDYQTSFCRLTKSTKVKSVLYWHTVPI